jgi:hypothetical protein
MMAETKIMKTRQEWILEVDLKNRGVHVPALEVGFPKQAGKNAYREK